MTRKKHSTSSYCDAAIGLLALLGILLFLTPGGWIVLILLILVSAR